MFSKAKSDCKGRHERSDDQSEYDSRAYTDQFPDERRRSSKHMHEELTKAAKYAKYIHVKNSQLLAEGNQPFALICIDEARELFPKDQRDPAMIFRALRRAMWHQTKSLSKDDPRQFSVSYLTRHHESPISPHRVITTRA